MKYLFVINPSAGQRKAKEIKHNLEQKIKGNKEFKRHAHKIIMPASVDELNGNLKLEIEKESISTVIAVGGDGTIATVVKSIIDYPRVNLGIIPHGTGNILASNLGISSELDAALETVFFGKEKLIDLGQVDGKPFTIMAGTGLPAEIIKGIKQEEKALLGIWAYFIKGLEQLYNAEEFDFEVTIDGKVIKTKSIAVFVSNAGNFMGPLPTITPEAKPTDEYLDVFIVSLKSLRENPVEYFQLFINYLTRNLKDTEAMQSYKAKNIIINSKPRLKVQADGDIVAETPIEIKILPKKLKVLVPNKPSNYLPVISDIIEIIEDMFNIKV